MALSRYLAQTLRISGQLSGGCARRRVYIPAVSEFKKNVTTRPFVTKSPTSAQYAAAAVEERDERPPQSKPKTRTRQVTSHATLTPNNQPSETITVTIDNTPQSFDAAFLRDSCTCPACVDPYSFAKLFQTADIPPEIKGSAKYTVDVQKRPSIEIKWHPDLPHSAPDHTTIHSIAWLRQALRTSTALQSGINEKPPTLWTSSLMQHDQKWLSYDLYMTSTPALHTALTHLHTHGLLFITDVPSSESSITTLASRIGTLKATFYNPTWDVRSKPQADNIAYTPDHLGLHMDLLYVANPPYLQILHFLRARASGGESFFADALCAAERLREENPRNFKVLAEFPVTYGYHQGGHHYHATRPTIELADPLSPLTSAIKRMNWAPPFQTRLEHSITSPSMREYVRAAAMFSRILNSEESLFELRVEEGTAVLFDNRRVLHARKAFDANSGERWLRGAYVDDDVFLSRARVVREEVEGRWCADGVMREVL